MTFCYFGHHKCATTWFASVIPAVCQDIGLSWESSDSPADFDFAADKAKADFLMFRNAGRNHLPPDRPYRGFHMIRDLRDIAVSAVHSHRSSHPTEMWADLKDMREKLKTMTFEESLLWELDYLKPVFDQIGSWNYSNPLVKELRMEDLISRPYQTALDAFQFLGLVGDETVSTTGRLIFTAKTLLNKPGRPVGHQGKRGPIRMEQMPAERFLGIVHAFNFKRLAGGREQGKEDTRSHFRKGVAGDWQKAFTPPVKARFKELYGESLVRLGYEPDLNW